MTAELKAAPCLLLFIIISTGIGSVHHGQARWSWERELSQEGQDLQAVPGQLGQVVAEGNGSSCVMFPDLVPTGVQLVPATANVQRTLRSCCASCASTWSCNAFAYCGRPEGCSSGLDNLTEVPFGGCQLSYQNASAPDLGRPLLAMAAPGFTGGAPLMNAAAPPPGYTVLLGVSVDFSFSCKDSLQSDQCVLRGTPAELAPKCTADPNCQVMQWLPNGRDSLGPNITIFKLMGPLVVNPNSALFVKEGAGQASKQAGRGGSSRNGSSISGAAVAGIGLGSFASAVLLTLAVALLLRHSRRRRRMGGQQQVGPLDSSDCEKVTDTTREQKSRGNSHSVPGSAVEGWQAGPVGGTPHAVPAVPRLGSTESQPEAVGGSSANECNSMSRAASCPCIGGLEQGAAATCEAGAGCAGTSSVNLLTAGTVMLDSTAAAVIQGAGTAQGDLALTTGPSQPDSGGAELSSSAGTSQALLSHTAASDSAQRRPAGGVLVGRVVIAHLPPVDSPFARAAQQAGAQLSAAEPGSAQMARCASTVTGGVQQFSLSSSSSALSLVADDPWPSTISSELMTVPSMLARLPEDLWETWIVDYDKIKFAQQSDGSLVELGSGSSGTVYKVTLDGMEGQPLAAKVVHLGANPTLQSQFLQEASLLRRLRHRNIVNFAGVSIFEEKGIILMELMEAKDLFSLLNVRSSRTRERAFGWYSRGKRAALDVARAIHYLHARGIAHLDIKSSNILLTRDFCAKLADVGFARVMNQANVELSSSDCGTFDYMAPELILGKQCNSAVDIFAYGIVLWEICSGERARRGRNPTLTVPDDCPQEVADLVAHCCAEDPALRPTALELVNIISRLSC